MTDHQIAVIGAGPYGLAAAAHLRGADLDTIVFGRPMEFWQKNMPEGMCLRSSWDASHIAAPVPHLSLDVYERSRSAALPRPLPLRDFIAYGLWFQRQTVPDVDSRDVVLIERCPAGYKMFLSDGECCIAGRVVVAAGIAPFACRPAFAQG